MTYNQYLWPYRGTLVLCCIAEPYVRGHELPAFIVTFDGLTLPYGELGL